MNDERQLAFLRIDSRYSFKPLFELLADHVADFRLPTSDFRLPRSEIRDPTSLRY
jgi:hypothetical protein